MDIESNSKESEKMVAEISPLLKFVLELGPLMVFFFANSRGEWLASTFPVLTEFGGPIFIATGLFMIATAVALSVSWVLTRKLPIMPLISGIVVFVFGALTLWLQNDTFIKMKPTIVNTLFGVILLGGLFFGQSLLGYVFNSAFRLTDEGCILPLSCGAERGCLAYVHHRHLGGLQGVGHDADHHHLHHGADAARHAPFAGTA